MLGEEQARPRGLCQAPHFCPRSAVFVTLALCLCFCSLLPSCQPSDGWARAGGAAPASPFKEAWTGSPSEAALLRHREQTRGPTCSARQAVGAGAFSELYGQPHNLGAPQPRFRALAPP